MITRKLGYQQIAIWRNNHYQIGSKSEYFWNSAEESTIKQE